MVQTLVHDGRVIIESTVICEYVDDQWSDRPLKPTDSFGRAQMRLWTKQLDEGLHIAVGILSFLRRLSPSMACSSGRGFRRDGWLRTYLRTATAFTVHSSANLKLPFFMPAFERYHKLFDDLKSPLSRSLWLVDEVFSLAEVGYAPYLARLRHLGFDVLFEQHPRVAEWSERVAKSPSVVEGVERWFNLKYLTLFAEKRSSRPILSGASGCCAKTGTIVTADNKPAADTSAAMALTSAPLLFLFNGIHIVLSDKLNFAFLVVNRCTSSLDPCSDLFSFSPCYRLKAVRAESAKANRVARSMPVRACRFFTSMAEVLPQTTRCWLPLRARGYEGGKVHS